MKKLLVVIFLIAGCSFNGRSSADMETINLPQPVLEGVMALEEAISARRSVRSFSDEDIDAQAVSMLLWSGQVMTDRNPG